MSDPTLGPSVPLVPPLYQASVYTLRDLDDLDRIINAQEAGFIYARDGHPNARHLADQLAALEEASWALITSSGMAAITAALVATVGRGDRVVASNRLYGRTTQLLTQELERFGVETVFVDACDLDQVRDALAAKPSKILLVETLSNPLLRVVDLAALAELAAEADCRLVVDNTFATPILVKPLALGADVVIESLTKMIGGHSDVTLGLVCGTDDQGERIQQAATIWGLSSNPFDCWLVQRSLPTLGLRMKAASANAAALADWLAEQAGVKRVIYPGRADHPDRELAERQYGGIFGNMLCFELDGGRAGVNRFLRAASGIPFSPSLAHTSTTCSHPGSTSHRYVSAAEKRKQGIGDGLIRLSVGIEEIDHIQTEIGRGLS